MKSTYYEASFARRKLSIVNAKQGCSDRRRNMEKLHCYNINETDIELSMELKVCIVYDWHNS